MPGGESAELTALRETVCALHAELVRNGLVAWTSGNVSARLAGSGLMVIKPSGVGYDDLTPASMVVCDLDGRPVSQGLSPSSDTATHAYIYRQMPEVGGWCTPTRPTRPRGRPGRTHPVRDHRDGRRVRRRDPGRAVRADRQRGDWPGRGRDADRAPLPRVLMASHGVFTIGGTARDAVKAAVMCEDVARTVHLARAFGELAPLAADQVDALHARYKNYYGQR